MEEYILPLKVIFAVTAISVALGYLVLSFSKQHNTTAFCKLLDRTTDIQIMLKRDESQYMMHYLYRINAVEQRIYNTSPLTKDIARVINTEIDIFLSEYKSTISETFSKSQQNIPQSETKNDSK